MRYLMATCVGGAEVLYLFERGIDLIDPRTDRARTDTVIVEFCPVPSELRAIVDIEKK